MLSSIAADAVVLLHLAFILFVVLGGLLVLRRPWLGWIHLPAVVWGVMIEFNGLICPLTPLEQHLRDAAGEGGYAGSFIEHYIVPLIYPAGLTRGIQIAIGVLVIVINLVFYTLLLVKLRSGDRRSGRG